MEEMFDSDDFKRLAQYLEMPDNTSYSNIMTSIICCDDLTIDECANLVSQKAKDNFRELFKMIDDVYKVSKNSNSEKELIG